MIGARYGISPERVRQICARGGIAAREIPRLLAWTEDEIAVLIRMWDLGRTARDIAIELGGAHLRNAVIGKANRLKLTPRPSPLREAA